MRKSIIDEFAALANRGARRFICPEQPFGLTALDGLSCSLDLLAWVQGRKAAARVIVFGDDASEHEQLEPSVICRFEDFCDDLALAETRRLGVLAAVLGIDALRPSDDISLDEAFTRGNPLLH